MNLFFSTVRMRQLVPLLLVLASAAAAVASYLQALDYPFSIDDNVYITENARLAGLPLAELWRLFAEPYNPASEFLPLRDLSYWFDITLFGLNPAAFRLHNILLYLLCLPLVYATTLELWRYFRPTDAASAPWAAAAVTALFALHPALVESVVWVSGRKYVLPNLFSMLALWFAMRARRKRGLSAPYAAATLAAFAAVMLSKSSYVAVAPVITLLWVLFWFDIPKPDRRRSQLLWPFAVLLLAGLLFLIFITHNKGFDSIPFYFGIEAVTRSLAVLGWLARLVVSPESRHFFYPVFEDAYLPAMVALGSGVLATAAASGILILRKRSLESFALVVFLLLCLPYMQLIPNKPPSLVSDRYVAFAVWASVLLVVALCWRLKSLPRTILLFAIALSWGFQTMERPRDWRSLETLIDSDLRAYPGYYMPAVYKITGVQLQQGLTREARDTANSITVPEFRNIMINLVKIDDAVTSAEATGNPQEAMALLWNLVLDLKQPPVQAMWNSPINNLWIWSQMILIEEGAYLVNHFPNDVSVRSQYTNAVAYLRAANESQHAPESARGAAFYNLGLALMNSGRVAEAKTPLLAALEQLPPDLRAHCLLSEVYKQTGRIEEAARAAASCSSRTSNAETVR